MLNHFNFERYLRKIYLRIFEVFKCCYLLVPTYAINLKLPLLKTFKISKQKVRNFDLNVSLKIFIIKYLKILPSQISPHYEQKKKIHIVKILFKKQLFENPTSFLESSSLKEGILLQECRISLQGGAVPGSKMDDSLQKPQCV